MTRSTVAWVCGSLAIGMAGGLWLAQHAIPVTPSMPSPQTTRAPTRTAPLQPRQVESTRPIPAALQPPLASTLAHIPPGPLARFVNPGSLTERLPATFPTEVSSVQDPAECSAVEGVLLDIHDDDAIRNEAANLLHRSGDPQLSRVLIEVLDRSDETERFRSFAAQHLGLFIGASPDSSASAARDRLIVALTDRHQAVRREALQALVHGRDSTGIDAFRAAWNAPSWNTSRDLLIRIAYELDCHDLSPGIRQALGSPDEEQQIAALYVLGQWNDQDSLAAMERAAGDPNLRIRIAASEAAQRCRTAHNTAASRSP